MAFNTLKEVEFNFIWFGNNRMPEGQAKNLLNFAMQHQDEDTAPTIIVWVDSDETHNTIMQQLQEIADKQGINRVHLERLRFEQANDDDLVIPPELAEFIEQTKNAKLWAGLSDIYRMLILSRPYKENEHHARFYVEADNAMDPKLWDLFANKDVATYWPSPLNKPGIFAPQYLKTDLLLLDITSDKGGAFASNMREYLLKILVTDPVLKIYFSELFAKASENQGLAERDVLGSYGMLVIALFRMHFMQSEQDNMYGFKDVIVNDTRMSELYKAITDTSRSWLDKTKTLSPISQGLLFKLMMLRIVEVSDTPDGVGMQALIKMFIPGATTKNVAIDSMINTWMKANRHEAQPEWLSEARSIINQEHAPQPSGSHKLRY